MPCFIRLSSAKWKRSPRTLRELCSMSNSGGRCTSRSWYEKIIFPLAKRRLIVRYCFQTTKTVREVNKPGQGALIFNVSSAGGYNANPGLAFYSSSKFGAY